MRLNAVLALTAALALGGCATSEILPGQTGSVRPPVGAGSRVSRADEAERALGDAISACLDRGVPVQTSAFRRCTTEAQRTALLRAKAAVQGSASAR